MNRFTIWLLVAIALLAFVFMGGRSAGWLESFTDSTAHVDDTFLPLEGELR